VLSGDDHSDFAGGYLVNRGDVRKQHQFRGNFRGPRCQRPRAEST
jgi:hypothetical protein